MTSKVEPVASVEAKENPSCAICNEPIYQRDEFGDKAWCHTIGGTIMSNGHVAEPKPTPSTPAQEPLWVQRVADDVDRQFAALPTWKQKSLIEVFSNRCNPQPDSSSISTQREVQELKGLLRQAAEGMDTYYEETHPKLVNAIKENCASNSISTKQLICKHCHKPIFADISYMHDDNDMVCDDGNTCAEPATSTEQTPEPLNAYVLMRFINHLCGGSAQGMLAYAKWAKGQSNGR